MLALFASWVALELSVVALYRFGVVVDILLHLAFLWFFSGLMLGLHDIAMAVVDGRVPRLKRLTASLGRGPSYLLALCLYLVAVAAGILLLVAPGVYLAVRWALFGQVLATKPASALAALRDAGSLADGRWWEACRVLLLALALNLAGAALLGLGLLISFPVSLLAISSFYRALEPAAATLGEPATARV